MKNNFRKYLSLMCIIALTVTFLAGCSKSPYDGDWAYVHDDKTVALTIKGKSAKVDSVECNVTQDGDILKLDNNRGNHFEVGPSDTKDQIILYKFTEYEYQGEGTPDSIVGLWKSKEKWEFEFTDQGTFKEDGYFPGYYSLDENAKTFKLVYNDHFMDTECSYTIEGNKLTVRYPWPMVKPTK